MGGWGGARGGGVRGLLGVGMNRGKEVCYEMINYPFKFGNKKDQQINNSYLHINHHQGRS